MFQTRRTMLLALGLLGLLASGCSHGGSSTPASNTGQSGQWSGYEAVTNAAQQRGKVVYQVTYQPNAVVFDEQATEHALKDISADGVSYTLDAASPAAAQLKAGSVLFLYGIAIRKVSGVRTQGSNVVATTADADITDAIKDGHIAWQVPMDFSIGAAPEMPTQKSALLEDLFARPAEAGPIFSELGKMSFEGTAGPVDWELAFAPVGDRVNIDMDAKLSKWGEFWEAKGEGYVQHVTDIGEIDINNGQISSMVAGVQDIQGHIDFEWQAQQQLPGLAQLLDQSFKVKIPGASVEFPLIIGGIPFV